MNQSPLIFENVTRRFGKRVAVDGLSLTVEPGNVLGLVGRNGSGKTTSLRLAHGILFPDDGRIRVLGLDPVEQGIQLRTAVSLLSEESALYPWMRVEEIVEFAGALHPRWDPRRASELLERLTLDPGQKLRELSRGTRAKVALLLAVASRPRLLLLDDPTAGLDPLVRREILGQILDSVAGDGGAVVYASHLVHDIERVADNIAFLDEGKLGLAGPLEELKLRIRRARAVFEGDAPSEPDVPGKIDWHSDGRMLAVVSRAENGELDGALRRMGAREVEIDHLSLEEILVACLRRGGRSEVNHV